MWSKEQREFAKFLHCKTQDDVNMACIMYLSYNYIATGKNAQKKEKHVCTVLNHLCVKKDFNKLVKTLMTRKFHSPYHVYTYISNQID